MLAGLALRLYGNDWGTHWRTGLVDHSGAPIAFNEADFHNIRDHIAAARDLDSPFPYVTRDGLRYLVTTYGHPYYYLLHLALRLDAAWNGHDFRAATPEAWDRAFVAGRALTALLSNLTIACVYWLGVRVFRSRLAALAGAACFAFMPLAIQSAHFASVDGQAGFFVVLALLGAVRARAAPTMGHALLAGALVGLAAAFRLHAAVTALAVWLALWIGPPDTAGAPRRASLSGAFGPPIIAASAAALFVFCVLNSASFLRPEEFWLGYVDANLDGDYADAGDLNALDGGPHLYHFLGQTPGDYVFTFRGHEYLKDSPPVWYVIDKLYPAALGWPAMLLIIVGLIASARHRPAWPLAAFTLAYFLIFSTVALKFARYHVPYTPALALFAGAGVQALARLPKMRWLGVLLASAALLHGIAFGVAFAGLYGRQDPRAAAVQWAAARSPDETIVVLERGHNRLESILPPGLAPAPVVLDITSLFVGHEVRYRPENVDARLSPDEVAARAAAELDWLCCQASGGGAVLTLPDHLSQGDLLIFTDDRYAARESFDLARVYYRELFTEATPFTTPGGKTVLANRYGLRLAAVFENAPSLWGLRFEPPDADPSFRQFDHPTVFVFERISASSAAATPRQVHARPSARMAAAMPVRSASVK